jgi:hypothetical protein
MKLHLKFKKDHNWEKGEIVSHIGDGSPLRDVA